MTFFRNLKRAASAAVASWEFNSHEAELQRMYNYVHEVENTVQRQSNELRRMESRLDSTLHEVNQALDPKQQGFRSNVTFARQENPLR